MEVRCGLLMRNFGKIKSSAVRMGEELTGLLEEVQ